MTKILTYCLINVITLVLITALPRTGESQDPVFSQYYMMPTMINPSLVGQINGPRFGLIYRNQWPAISNAYETFGFSYDQFLENIHSGIGVTLLSDQAGDGILNSIKIQGQYAYRIETRSGWNSQLAVEVGFGQQTIDRSSLVFLDQLDPRFGAISPGGTPYPTEEPPFATNSRPYLDIGAGLSIYNERYFISVGVDHLNRPSVSFREQENGSVKGVPVMVNAIIGAKFIVREGTTYNPQESYISPTILYAQQGGTAQINGGIFYGFSYFTTGVYYRHTFTNPDAVGVSASVQLGNLKIGYAYDFTVSSLGISTGGSHEIGMALLLEGKDYKYEDCFNMFR